MKIEAINGKVVRVSIIDLKLNITEKGLPVKNIPKHVQYFSISPISKPKKRKMGSQSLRITNEPRFHKLKTVQQNLNYTR